MPIPNKPGYTHGSTGSQPGSPRDYASGDPVDANEFDYYVNTPFETIKDIIDALNNLDSDDDGTVDAADQADNATKVKGNDIDSDGDGVVNEADVANETNEFVLSFNLPETYIQSGDHARMRLMEVPQTTQNLVLRSVGVNDSSGNTPSGLEVIIYNQSTSTVVDTFNVNHSQGNTLTSYTNLNSGNNIIFAVNNGDFSQAGTGGDVLATGHINIGWR